MSEESRVTSVAARLLLSERDALLPALRSIDVEKLVEPTCLPGWSVRDVLAHCSAALAMAAKSSWHGFSPTENQSDVDARRTWPFDDVLVELEAGYADTARAIIAAEGRLDALALGEWIHGGDVREALGLPDAYASAGVNDALVLLGDLSRLPDLNVPRTVVTLSDRGEVILGSYDAEVSLVTDTATLFRLCAGRNADPGRYRLTGANASAFTLFN
ncbi:maleylpyruvate isomerase family mycothiol-dependent enzyme [Rhodococcus sp. H29-C3]|uniref:maleylpyruvate isomerase family mycothiol-dependent enzyme n=1 Tax=Rhodococcus sp. H29-C3 TaxID=3046307 RepID=UPI0024BB8258|nr:maleylpyruvate isomerase family mycothiol-dependent enzyme [Rhodococcus sp. H29-C3]MDJ0363130.1 maleylpyruvate isomerase family mycothiol-dependent enzyme [Rhodococcus sp. H29-C3]